MNSRAASLALIMAAFTALSAVGGQARADEAFPLGVALALTGPGAPYSADGLKAIQLAVEQINAEGGFLRKHPIRLIVRDTKTRPDAAKIVVQDMIAKERIRAVIGTYSSASAMAIKSISRDNKILHIATISNAEEITKLDFSPYTYSVVPNTYMMAKAVAIGTAKLARLHGWTRYVTIASDYAWGRSSQQLQVQFLKETAPQLQLVREFWPPLGQTTFNTYVVGIMNLSPDFVLESVAGADAEYWGRDARDYGLHRKIAVPGALLSVTELVRDGKLIRRGIYARTRAPFFAHLNVPMMARFVEAYRAKFAQYPSDWAVMSYDGVYALKQGIEKAGTTEPEKVKDAMRGLRIETTRGHLFFREIDNQLSASAYFGRVGDDRRYPFPILVDLTELKGPDIWRPEAEILAARRK